MKPAVLITGTNRGLGYFLVKEFLNQGYKVVSLSRSMSPELENLREQHRDTLLHFQADVTKPVQLKDIAENFSELGIRLEILINNAAVHFEHQDPGIESLKPEIILETLRGNSVAPLSVVQHFLPYVRKMIVNISSEAGSIENCWRAGQFGYCMSKAALNMASKILQNRLEEENIKVLAVHPQWFRSDMGGEQAPLSTAEAAEQVRKTILKDWSLTDPIFVDSETSEKIAW